MVQIYDFKIEKPLRSNHKKIKMGKSSTCGLVTKLLHKIHSFPYANSSPLLNITKEELAQIEKP